MSDANRRLCTFRFDEMTWGHLQALRRRLGVRSNSRVVELSVDRLARSVAESTGGGEPWAGVAAGEEKGR